MNVKQEDLLFMFCLAYPKIFENFKRNEENYDEYEYSFDGDQEETIEIESHKIKELTYNNNNNNGII